jgi:transketolase
VVPADGHDFCSLLTARDESTRALEAHGAPVVIIANTVKGNGIGHLHDTIDSHYLPLDDAQYEMALDGLTSAHEATLNGYRNAR